MEIIINEKKRMTKDEFAKKWWEIWGIKQHVTNKDHAEFNADLNSLLGSQPEETVEYPCLMVSDNGNLYYLTDQKIGHRITYDGELDVRYNENWTKNMRPFHGEITIKQ